MPFTGVLVKTSLAAEVGPQETAESSETHAATADEVRKRENMLQGKSDCAGDGETNAWSVYTLLGVQALIKRKQDSDSAMLKVESNPRTMGK
jgi:hypothetical protein